MNQLPIPTNAIPSLRAFADALSCRLGKELNYAQAYIALASAQASGHLQAIGCHDFLQHADDPKLVELMANLLEQHPGLLDELQRKARLQGF